MVLDDIVFGGDGLVPVVVQDRASGEVRMLAWADHEALSRTLETGLGHFWSRSRKARWQKGESSGHVLRVREVWTDCDRDAVVYGVDPEGPTCHTGAPGCFFTPVQAPAGAERAEPVLARLEATIAARASASAERSYTRSLLDGGAPAVAAKIREEAEELARAIEGEDASRVVSECADLVFHALVGLRHRGVGLPAVLLELARRAGTSGHAEKASRR